MGWWDGVASLGGAIAGGIGAAKAGDAAKDAQKDAIKAQKAAGQQAQGMYAPYVQQGQGGNAYMQQAMGANPATLTPGQQIMFDDMMRGANRSLNAGPLAGAGRSTNGILKQMTDNFMAQSYDQNRARSDAAAENIAGRGFQATAGQANAAIGTGNNIAQGFGNLAPINAGRAAAPYQAGSDIMGAISGLISSARRKDPTSSAPTGVG